MKKLAGSVSIAILALTLGLFLDHGRCLAAPPDLLSAIPTAQAWEFTDLHGMSHKVDWLAKGQRGVLVFFFDLQSPDSLLGLNYLDALCRRAADFGLSVIGVEATGRQGAEVSSLLQNYVAVYKTPSFPVIADPNYATAKIFGRHQAPTVLLIGDRGRIVARRAVFDFGTAVEMTRLAEQLLQRNEGFFSPALRELGLSAPRERLINARAEARDEEDQAGKKALVWGDQLPDFDFTDTAGRVGRWAWRGGGVIRAVLFWSGGSPNSADDLTFFQGLHTSGGAEFLEIIAVESTGLRAAQVSEILTDFTRKHPAPSFTVVPDPQRRLVGLFGAGDPLPQTFLVGGIGEVLYRGDGLGAGERRVLKEKIDRAVGLAGLGLPHAPREVSDGIAEEVVAIEAPSIRRRLELDESLRFNLSRGDYFFHNGQYERAVLYYQRYLELEPASLHAVVRLAQIYDLVREPVKAREYWERVLGIRPDHAEGRARVNEFRRTGVR